MSKTCTGAIPRHRTSATAHTAAAAPTTGPEYGLRVDKVAGTARGTAKIADAHITPGHTASA